MFNTPNIFAHKFKKYDVVFTFLIRSYDNSFDVLNETSVYTVQYSGIVCIVAARNI